MARLNPRWSRYQQGVGDYAHVGVAAFEQVALHCVPDDPHTQALLTQLGFWLGHPASGLLLLVDAPSPPSSQLHVGPDAPLHVPKDTKPIPVE